MSIQKSIITTAHNNIYTDEKRKLRIEYCLPGEGVNIYTGILVIVPGFGGNIDSNVYKKIRKEFADKYNFVTIQSDYFGSKYMQQAELYDIDDDILNENFTETEIDSIAAYGYNKLLELLIKKKKSMEVKAFLDESLQEFNDMSFMQSIDIIRSIETVKEILDNMGVEYDRNRVIGYGHSHGAYLIHLSNILSPNLFSYIIDNSAWIIPKYLFSDRYLQLGVKGEEPVLSVRYEYLAKGIVNKEILSLNKLYETYNGKTQILVFQGDNDQLVDYKEKQELISTIENAQLILVKKSDIDYKKYKSNEHGLGADFLELLSYALEQEDKKELIEETTYSEYIIDLGTVCIKSRKRDSKSEFIFS